jgi:hypothetical protein
VPAPLEKLRRAGYKLAILSNGDRDMLDAARPHIGFTFDHVISVEEAGYFKPYWRTYATAEKIIGEDRSKILFVANHAFDCIGANPTACARHSSIDAGGHSTVHRINPISSWLISMSWHLHLLEHRRCERKRSSPEVRAIQFTLVQNRGVPEKRLEHTTYVKGPTNMASIISHTSIQLFAAGSQTPNVLLSRWPGLPSSVGGRLLKWNRLCREISDVCGGDKPLYDYKTFSTRSK